MKRLCICVIYDQENIIDSYIIHMLKEVKTCCTYLLVVCNAKSDWQGEDISLYADQVVYRENVGYDAGGYKDALCIYTGWSSLDAYDELILLNDSFYGPFYPLQRIFQTMDAVIADFWGLTRSQAGMMPEGMRYEAHIQSYFLVFRKAVIRSGAFRTFWELLTYPHTMDEAIKDFELGINKCLKRNGFRDAALSDLYSSVLTARKNENPYMEYPLQLIRDCRIPILKYKALFFGNSGYAGALKAVRFIQENNLYSTEYIEKHIMRKSKSEKGWIDFEVLEKFQKTHRRIFIYGFGTYGKNLGLYFQYRAWETEGFLVTSTTEKDGQAIPFEQAQIEADDGIVVAVGKRQMCMEIQAYLQNKCKEEQLLFPNL